MRRGHVGDADIPDGEVRGWGLEIRYFEPYARIWALPDKPGCRGACDQERWTREENRRGVPSNRELSTCIQNNSDKTPDVPPTIVDSMMNLKILQKNF